MTPKQPRSRQRRSDMGFARRVVRKTVRKATPRAVRRAVHPVRTLKNAATPRSVRQLSRGIYTITNPLGAAENAVIGAALNSGSRRRRSSTSASRRSGSPRSSAGDSRTTAPSEIRAAEGARSHDQLAALMMVQRERFTPSQRPEVPRPAAPDPRPFARSAWNERKHEVKPWQINRRRALRAETQDWAHSHATDLHAQAIDTASRQQVRADAWWTALGQGEVATVGAALEAAFADNPAPVTICGLDPTSAFLAVILPDLDVLPARRAHVTPGGRLSVKDWTQTDLNETYADLLGAHLLATARETWAVAPALQTMHVVGLLDSDDEDHVLFYLQVNRDGAPWQSDSTGRRLLDIAAFGLKRVGRTHQVALWPESQLPTALYATLAQHQLIRRHTRG